MQITDDIYGETDIDEPLLVDLISSRAVQRLKGVTMGGITAILGISPPTSRYEHSVGAMLLTRKLGGSLQEQAASLLHDVSHTAFSHVIDFVFGTPQKQAFHDEWKAHYVAKTDLPEIAERHGVDISGLIDEDQYSILEQPKPRLCADRVDYTLRDLEPLQVASASEATALSDRLVVIDGRMAFDAPAPARRFAEAYLACAERSWSNPRQVALYELCGRALKRAFEKDLLREEDIWLQDEAFWAKLLAAAKHDDALRQRAELVSATTPISIADDSQTADLEVRAKPRWVDPDVAVAGELTPLSHIDMDFSNRLEAYKTSIQKTVHVAFG